MRQRKWKGGIDWERHPSPIGCEWFLASGDDHQSKTIYEACSTSPSLQRRPCEAQIPSVAVLCQRSCGKVCVLVEMDLVLADIRDHSSSAGCQRGTDLVLQHPMPPPPLILCSMSTGLAEMSGLLGVTRVYGGIEGPAILCSALSPRIVRGLVPGKL